MAILKLILILFLIMILKVKGLDYVTKHCAFEGSIMNACKPFESAEHCSVCESNLCNFADKVKTKISFIVFCFIVSTNLFFDYSAVFA